jgi:hypothetical protein
MTIRQYRQELANRLRKEDTSDETVEATQIPSLPSRLLGLHLTTLLSSVECGKITGHPYK